MRTMDVAVIAIRHLGGITGILFAIFGRCLDQCVHELPFEVSINYLTLQSSLEFWRIGTNRESRDWIEKITIGYFPSG